MKPPAIIYPYTQEPRDKVDAYNGKREEIDDDNRDDGVIRRSAPLEQPLSEAADAGGGIFDLHKRHADQERREPIRDTFEIGIGSHEGIGCRRLSRPATLRSPRLLGFPDQPGPAYRRRHR